MRLWTIWPLIRYINYPSPVKAAPKALQSETQRGPGFVIDPAKAADKLAVKEMKAKIFDVVLHNIPAGKSPATHLEEQLNNFLKQHPNLQIQATHMNTLVVPAGRGPTEGSETTPSSVIIFSTLFYA